MPHRRHALSILGIGAAFALGGCALLSGAIDLTVVDCAATPNAPTCVNGADSSVDVVSVDTSNGAPDDGTVIDNDSGPLPNDASTLPDVPEGCNPATDLACLKLPDGWFLYATAPMGQPGSGAPPTCPTGFGSPFTAGESPTADADACLCDCRVSAAASCAGEITATFGLAAPPCTTPAGAGAFTNNPLNTCIQSVVGVFPAVQRFTLPNATGGACANDTPIEHPENVTWAQRTRMCRQMDRCDDETKVCDARVDAPFTSCLSRMGDVACDVPGWPTKKLVSEEANVECGTGTCGCTVTRSCTGSIAHYTDLGCTTGEVRVQADNICRATGLSNAGFVAYKAAVQAQTSCTETGAAVATSVTLAQPRTICCK